MPIGGQCGVPKSTGVDCSCGMAWLKVSVCVCSAWICSINCNQKSLVLILRDGYRGYPRAIKHCNWKSPTNGKFNEKIFKLWLGDFPANHVWHRRVNHLRAASLSYWNLINSMKSPSNSPGKSPDVPAAWPMSRWAELPGQVRIKRRLGRQHEDHLNGFMRVTGLRALMGRHVNLLGHRGEITWKIWGEMVDL